MINKELSHEVDLKDIPKIELHRHLEGSIRLNTMIEIAKDYRIPMPSYDQEVIRHYYQITEADPKSFLNFLGKFNFIRNFWVNKEVIERVAYEAVEDAAADNIKYLELRFSPVHFARRENFPVEDVTQWVINSARKAAKKYNIDITFIATISRNFSSDINKPAFDVAYELAGRDFIGLDLAGDEINYPAKPFLKDFLKGYEKGLKITIHAGEVMETWQNVKEAIIDFKALRIGHGYFAYKDEQTLELAKRHNVTFEMCITSNLQTGACYDVKDHAIKILRQNGAKVTINSDNPCICNTTLTEEFEKAVRGNLIDESDIPSLLLNACEGSFLPQDKKNELAQKLLNSLTNKKISHAT